MFQCCSSAAEEARKEIYVQKFLHIAGLLNEQLSTTPLLYGSLGLERRLSADLNADDIDVLILEKFLKDEWCRLVDLMEADRYRFIDLREHEFRKEDVTVAHAAPENLPAFAGVDISRVPVIEADGSLFLPLEAQLSECIRNVRRRRIEIVEDGT